MWGWIVKVRLGVLISILIIVLSPVYLRFVNNVKPDRVGIPESCQLPADEKDTFIIFLSGINSRCDGTAYNYMGFKHIRRQLARVGLSYKDEHFLMYSYTGGKVKGGGWIPNPYKPLDTGQPIQLSVMQLREMIEEFSRYHPRAKFLLVGHSLGGRIAFDYVTMHQPGRAGQGPIKGLITLNSPLTGTPYKQVVFMAAVKPIWGAPAVRQLVAEYQLPNETGMQKQKINAARRLTSEGVYLATFGTRQDIIVPPVSACLTDKQGHPLTKGQIVSVSEFPGNFDELLGHRQILKDEQVAKSIIYIYTNPEL